MMKHWVDTYTAELERLEKVLAKYEEIKKTCDSPSLERKIVATKATMTDCATVLTNLKKRYS